VTSFSASLRQYPSPDWRLRAKITVPPAESPITLEQVKAQLRITNTAEDAYLQTLIDAATAMAQRVLGRYFVTQTMTAQMDSRLGPMGLSSDRLCQLWGDDPIQLRGLPVQSVESVTVIDDNDAETVVPSAAYFLDGLDDDMAARIGLTGSGYWPSADARLIASVRFVYVVGYGDPADVPADIQLGLSQLVAYLYANRGDCGCSDEKCVAMCGGFGSLLQHKIMRI